MDRGGCERLVAGGGAVRRTVAFSWESLVWLRECVQCYGEKDDNDNDNDNDTLSESLPTNVRNLALWT